MVKCIKEIEGKPFIKGELYRVAYQDEHDIFVEDDDVCDWVSYAEMDESFFEFSDPLLTKTAEEAFTQFYDDIKDMTIYQMCNFLQKKWSEEY